MTRPVTSRMAEDVPKRDLRVNTWEESAQDRTCWKQDLPFPERRGANERGGRGETRAKEASHSADLERRPRQTQQTQQALSITQEWV